MTQRRPQRHCLYRFFDAEGELLYVGITMNPAARWPKHSYQKPWWCEVESITLETFDSRADVLAAEREAIKTEHPRHNIVHVEKPEPPPTAPPEEIDWECECGDLVADGEGALLVLHYQYDEYREALESWEARRPSSGRALSVSYLMEHPGTVPWRVLHDDCTDPDAPLYEIGVENLRTPAQLLAYTAHLMTKSWLECTDWDYLLLRVCRRLPATTKGGS